jgi:hypothetical protein
LQPRTNARSGSVVEDHLIQAMAETDESNAGEAE